MIQRCTRGRHERLLIIHLAHRFTTFSKSPRVRSEYHETSLGKAVGVISVKFRYCLGHRRNIGTSRRQVFPPTTMAMWRNNDRTTFPRLHIVGDQRVERHHHIWLRVNLYSGPGIAITHHRLCDHRSGISCIHGVDPGDRHQMLPDFRTPDFKSISIARVNGQFPGLSIKSSPHSGMGGKESFYFRHSNM